MALQVALANALGVKVDREQRRRRLHGRAPRILAALDLAVALERVRVRVCVCVWVRVCV